MSVWYDVTVTAFGDEEDLAKLLHVKTEDIRGLNQIDLSFGQKNGPGVDLESLAKNNNGLALLVKTTVECFSGSTFLLKYDVYEQDFQYVPLERVEYDTRELNQELIAQFPELQKELTTNKYISWKSFFWDDSKRNSVLKQHTKYQNTVVEIDPEDFELDNAEWVDA